MGGERRGIIGGDRGRRDEEVLGLLEDRAAGDQGEWGGEMPAT